jgi:beta-barrel assembly-enhancing protease
MSGRSQPDESMTFEGGAFDSTLEGGKAFGTVRVAYNGVIFESAKGTVALPLDGLEIKLGGANDRLIFFSHPSQPKTAIHTADHAALKHPLLAGHHRLTAQIGAVRMKKRVALGVFLGIVFLLVAGLVGLVMSLDKLSTAAASAIPVDAEIKLGDTLFNQIKGGSKLVEDPVVLEQLKLLTGPLVEGIGDAKYPLKFHIVEDATLNAFAMPGGNVVLHTGLLLAADTPEEVAGVLGHEIAHVTKRHGFRGIISSAGLYILVSTLVGDVSSILAVVADNSAFLLDQKFSRDFEREADEVGWDYLLKADIDPRGMVGFFKKLQEEEKRMLENSPVGGIEGALSVLSTHPATEERIATLEAKIKTLPPGKEYRKFALNYAEFKDSLRSKLHTAPSEKRK